jgi:hypothetical protein
MAVQLRAGVLEGNSYKLKTWCVKELVARNRALYGVGLPIPVSVFALYIVSWRLELMQVTSRVLRGPCYPIHRPFVSISTECSDIVAECFRRRRRAGRILSIRYSDSTCG